MGLETITYISDFVVTNPVGAVDPKSQGDDHIRGIKVGIKNTFPSITGAVTLSHTQINDAAQLSAANVFTASIPIRLSNGTPALSLNETDQGADGKEWRLRASGGNLTVSTYTDAGVLGASGITIGRSGTAIGTIALAGSAITLNSVNITDYARLSQANVFTANQSITKASPFLDIIASTATDSVIQYSTNSTVRGIVGAVGASNGIVTGSAVGDLALRAASGGLLFSGNGGPTLHFGLSSSGVLTTPNLSASEVGYKGAPFNNQNGNYTLVLSDAGKYVQAITTSGTTITIPANASVAFPIGTVISLGNITGGNISIAVTSDSLALGGTGTTGTRTLAHNGVATIIKVTSTAWIISGAGLT